LIGEELELAIELEKSVYRLDEQIFCKITLTNRGSESLAVNRRLLVNTPHAPPPYREITFDVLSPSENPVQFGTKINVGSPGEEDIIVLEPGSSVDRTYELTKDFDFDELGEYTVQATYENQSDLGRGPGDRKGGVWIGRLESNILNFQIK
jgi:hypothetical protein